MESDKNKPKIVATDLDMERLQQAVASANLAMDVSVHSITTEEDTTVGGANLEAFIHFPCTHQFSHPQTRSDVAPNEITGADYSWKEEGHSGGGVRPFCLQQPVGSSPSPIVQAIDYPGWCLYLSRGGLAWIGLTPLGQYVCPPFSQNHGEDDC
ncbi:hypothetical protein J6590_065231 [Homalodisca vitripennis]|nr:hypothetical protein J6590_065231 [Homalodisca vitripennis]